MASRTVLDPSIPPPAAQHLDRGYGVNSLPQSSYLTTTDPAAPGNPMDSSPLSQSVAQQNHGRFNEEWDASRRGSSILDGPAPHPNAGAVPNEATPFPSRGGTLKKKASVKRATSLKRSSSRRSSRAGSVRSLALTAGDVDEMHSAFFSPVPTTGNPTEALANRFQAWRKVLKDLIAYFKEIQAQYDSRSKSILKVSNFVNNTSTPPVFLSSGGIDDGLQILRTYHKAAIMECTKAKEIENDVILALVGLRSDLNQKIKEIKNLSGDFKNSVEKEMDATRRAVNNLQESLGQADVDPSQMTGKQDPYLLRLAVDRQLERQIDEENYLHQAYLNLEASGRELESIVVGEIQKAYNAYAGILKREADGAYAAVEELRTGPIAMPKDHEWNRFIETDEHFVDPRIPIRDPQNIHYPGKDNELAAEVRAGLMERKSKYLKSYTAGWYVLTPTHLHEFKSADKSQAPIMSLYLPEQKLGSRSAEGASSNKFMLKGRQTGSLHRGHSWVFRVESYDTLLEWYNDIKALTEKSPQERSAYVRQHTRSISAASQRAGSVASSDGVVDEEDEEPFSADTSAIVNQGPKQDILSRRPQPGGRFPSDIQVNTERGLQAPLSPSSGSSGFADFKDRDVAIVSGGLPADSVPVGQYQQQQQHQYGEDPNVYGQSTLTHATLINQAAQEDGVNPYTYERIPQQSSNTAHPDMKIQSGAGSPSGLGIATANIPRTNFYDTRDEQPPLSTAQSFNQGSEGQGVGNTMVVPVPVMQRQQLEQQAMKESSTVAAPDVPISQELQPTDTYLGAGAARYDGVSDTGTESTHMDDIQTPRTSDSIQSVPGSVAKTFGRPVFNGAPSHGSGISASQLHVPGEYPRDPRTV
ncbi:hypothetical protein F5884DRAFT_18945 [Xylogone sp. PMI_703]|nr:hypothetical protein F5884DRAFT_18945 [Xylogone sp. PMI_703]